MTPKRDAEGPREWTLTRYAPDSYGDWTTFVHEDESYPAPTVDEEIPVIEKSAYEAVVRERDEWKHKATHWSEEEIEMGKLEALKLRAGLEIDKDRIKELERERDELLSRLDEINKDGAGLLEENRRMRDKIIVLQSEHTIRTLTEALRVVDERAGPWMSAAQDCDKTCKECKDDFLASINAVCAALKAVEGIERDGAGLYSTEKEQRAYIARLEARLREALIAQAVLECDIGPLPEQVAMDYVDAEMAKLRNGAFEPVASPSSQHSAPIEESD